MLEASAQELVVGPLRILPEEHLVRARGRVLMLSTRELRLLTELARREDHIVPREELFTLVWERPMRARDRSVDVYVRKLRVKLEAALPSGDSSTRTSGSATGSRQSGSESRILDAFAQAPSV
jgi:DNA-binding response OmpR family regulator